MGTAPKGIAGQRTVVTSQFANALPDVAEEMAFLAGLADDSDSDW